jgi:hypothetical protein
MSEQVPHGWRAAVPGFVGAVVIVAAVVVMIPVLGWVAWFLGHRMQLW